MNARGHLYLLAHRLLGGKLPRFYQQFMQEDNKRDHTAIVLQNLQQILAHCTHVPYYRKLMAERNITAIADPFAALTQMPILTKSIIREQTENLKSDDLPQRHWFYNSSGGATGEPIRLIQDATFRERVDAQQMLYSTWAGLEVGDCQLSVWGLEQEILHSRQDIKIVLANMLTNRIFLNAFRMSPATMRQFFTLLNRKQPRLIVAYVQAMYELAQYARREHAKVRPQQAIITTAGMLYPQMRETIQEVFGGAVFNRYGSREVGDIAGECSQHSGLHVLPWGSYVEIVDDQGNLLPAGNEGRILVTCLSNYAMPLIRYDIGDRGALAADNSCPCGRSGQMITHLAGRVVDIFTNAAGVKIAGGYFIHLLFFREWVWKFQIVQVDVNAITIKIVQTEKPCPPADLDEITRQTRVVMGEQCAVNFDFVDEIPQLASGKYRYTVSLVTT